MQLLQSCYSTSKTKEDQQTPLETKRDPWRPGRNNEDQAETHGEQGRPPETMQHRPLETSRHCWTPSETIRETSGDLARPSERTLETRQDNWTPAETPGD